jgi:dTDP-4-dehydrorhamnose reductase
MINKIIIFGANGMLGHYMFRYFSNQSKLYEVIGITRKEFDITDQSISQLDKFLLQYHLNSHTCIINCIGFIPQKENTRTYQNYYIINSIFPQYLSKICKKYNTKIIFPTTDCVFNGLKGDYTEDDFHNETNSYGISKSLGELVNGTIIRVSIIGEEKNSSVSFLEFVKNSTGMINGWNNHFWNGITCFQYCKIIDRIITMNIFWEGVRHIYSPEKKSKYELACIIKDTYHTPCIINQYEAKDAIDKTLSSIYDISEQFCIPSLEQQIKEQATFKI